MSDVARPFCRHKNACRAKGAGHCQSCHGHLRIGKWMSKRGAKGAEVKRAKKVPITLAGRVADD